MDAPSIDKLLDNVHGMYELAAVAGKRAIEIKRTDRDNLQPLQQALEEIKEGYVDFNYKKKVELDLDAPDGEQIKLPLTMDADQAKLETSIVGETVAGESLESIDEVTDERQAEETDEMAPEAGVLEEDYSPKILGDDTSISDDD